MQIFLTMKIITIKSLPTSPKGGVGPHPSFTLGLGLAGPLPFLLIGPLAFPFPFLAGPSFPLLVGPGQPGPERSTPTPKGQPPRRAGPKPPSRERKNQPRRENPRGRGRGLVLGTLCPGLGVGLCLCLGLVLGLCPACAWTLPLLGAWPWGLCLGLCRLNELKCCQNI